MKRLAPAFALIVLLGISAPVGAADFPEQGNPQSCDVLISLPKDVIGQIYDQSPQAADRLLAQLVDACD